MKGCIRILIATVRNSRYGETIAALPELVNAARTAVKNYGLDERLLCAANNQLIDALEKAGEKL